MDIEQGLRSHLLDRAGAPIPADLTARLASRIEPRRRAGLRSNRRNVGLAMGSIAAVLVAAFLMYEVATMTPTNSGPALATGTSTPSPSPSPSPTLLAHPTGSTDVILSLTWDVRPAFRVSASQQALREDTAFVMYGDGTAIYGTSPMSLALRTGPSQFAMYTVTLDPQQVDAILHLALDVGRLRDARSYAINAIPSRDANLFVDADGVAKGLYLTDPGSDDPSLSSGDRSIRTAVGWLVEYLDRFADSDAARGPEGLSPYRTLYRADRYLAVLDEGFLRPPYPWGSPSLSRWPWPDVPPSAFLTGSSPARTRVITPAEYDALIALPTAYDTGIAVRGPKGGNDLISVRPLLPDEVTPP